MIPSAACYALVKRFEGFCPTAYRDAGGVWTIGWGNTVDVVAGDTCTQDQAEAWFLIDIARATHVLAADVKVLLTQNQFDALVSLTFNIGAANFGTSTLLQKLNQSDFAGAAAEFTRWNKAGGRRLAGLYDRRLAEQELFNTPQP